MKRIINVLLAVLLIATGQVRAETSEITYYVPDAQGSPIAAMDEQGNVKWRKHYQPYGQEIEQGPASENNRIGYTGHAHDRSTGLTYMGARYYDPAIGRFLSMDPAAVRADDPRTFNRYGYANNSPYNFLDPDGREPLDYGRAVWNEGFATLASAVPAIRFASHASGTDLKLDYVDQVDGERGEWLAIGAELLLGARGIVRGLEKGVVKQGAKGASGELKTVSGNKYHGNSTGSSATGGAPRAPMNPKTREALDGVQNPSRTHGHCCEIDAINKALNAGDDVRRATMGPVKLNESGRVIPPCSTCREVMKALGVE